MSVPSSPRVRAGGSPVVSAPADPAAESSFDARWAAWIERGRQDDVATRRKLRIAFLGAAIIGIVVALFFALR